MNTRTHLTTAALALAGAGLWYSAGGALQEKGGFEHQPNPLGIKRSPYGQVLAMAIQTPIDGDWHGGIELHDHAPGESCDSCDSCDHHADHPIHDSNPEDSDPHEGCDHDHGVCDHDHGHKHDHQHEDDHGHDHEPTRPEAGREPLLARLDRAVTQRTNPNVPTAAHQRYLRREIERKLRFAYDLDPSHYANYNSYNLFISQSALRTDQLTQEQARELVFRLADRTIRYCLRESEDPRPALTAASAAYNVLEQMLLADSGTYPMADFHRQLALIDHCHQRHIELLEASLRDGRWELLSPQRQQEVVDRSRFTVKLREAAAKAIQLRESTASRQGS